MPGGRDSPGPKRRPIPTAAGKRRPIPVVARKGIPELTLDRWSVDATRPEDLFVARIEFVHMVRTVTGTGPDAKAWVGPDKTDESSIILHLQAQNIAEEAFFETAADLPVARPEGKELDIDTPSPPAPKPPPVSSAPHAKDIPVGTRLAGPSRLVFRVPKGAPPIGYSIAEILEACRGLALRLAATALPPAPPARAVPQFQPAWAASLQGLLSGGAAKKLAPAVRARGVARLQRWQDESALVPVTRPGPQNLVPAPTVKGQQAVAVGRRLLIGPASDRPVVVTKPTVARPELNPPGREETALELPFRLWISPNLHARWVHATGPVRSTVTGRAELWHSRLATLVATPDGTVVDETDNRLRTVRAIWARDAKFGKDLTKEYPDHSTTDPFRMSLDASDRWDIVHESANFKIPKGAKKYYEPQPIAVDRLMLTALGAWLDARGQWDPPPKFEVEEWRHRATMGRDHYVRVVYKGYLFPFGHRASLIKVTERKFHPDVAGHPAFLRQRMYIVVRQPLLTFSEPQLKNDQGHFFDFQMPLVSARITTLVTPDLDDPAASDYPMTPKDGGKEQSLFWPKVGGQLFRFHIVAEDNDANRVEFNAPLIFVSNRFSQDANILRDLRDGYEANDLEGADGSTDDLCTVDLHGQQMAFAESSEPGDTTFEVDQLVLGAEIPTSTLSGDRALFYPRVQKATVVIPTIKHFTGATGKTEVNFPHRYLTEGLPRPGAGDANPGAVFLEAQPVPLDFSSGGDRSGGLAQPNLSVSGISRTMGPIGGDTDILAAGSFEPSQFFDAIKAKLFGVIELGELIKQIGVGDLDPLPKFVTEALGAADSFLKQMQRAQAQVEQLRVAANAAGENLDSLVKPVKDAVLQAIAAVGAMLGGDLDPGNPSAALDALGSALGTLRAGVKGLTSGVPSEVKKASLAVIDTLAKDIADVTGFVESLTSALQVPDELKVSFEWKPILEDWPVPGNDDQSIFLNHNKNGDATFTVSASVEAKTKLKPEPSFDVACRLHNFSLNLFPEASFLRLHFNKIEFSAHRGSKADVTCDFDGVEFVGVLSFVEALRDFIPLDGFSDPPALEVSEKGIVASYALGLPDASFGVFSLQHLSLGAGFTVPFLLDPLSVRFNFCERQSPFLLTVSAIGGGGFFGITLDPDGIQMLEASFECGANLAINLGVASGSVHIMLGIYFKMQGDKATLEGYFRIGGEMDVLGLISASIELYLSLTYEFSSGKCVGRATLTVEIEILFFSASVEVSCERRFAGSSGDPTFVELMGPDGDRDPWADYCEAFA